MFFQLPFSGSWFCFWGGDTKELNHHHDNDAQKYALDFVVRNKDGKHFEFDGSTNKDYYAYGQPIRAAADGKIIEIVDGIRDNVPNKTTNDYMNNGNSVLIQHTGDTYSLYAHMLAGEMRVKTGDIVSAGQVIGLCGNSGNSSEPHLHFEIRDSKDYTALDDQYRHLPIAHGIKPYFNTVTLYLDNATKKLHKYSPIKGDTVSN